MMARMNALIIKKKIDERKSSCHSDVLYLFFEAYTTFLYTECSRANENISCCLMKNLVVFTTKKD